jgi:hypothetical protein
MKRQHSTQTLKHKWATFTYEDKETLYITNMFRHTDLKIAFRTNNNLESLLRHRNPPTDKFALSGVYKFTCPDYNKALRGTDWKSFSIRYKEHISAFHNNSHTSKFAQHLQEEAHSFGPISNIMQVFHQRKCAHLNTIERFYIHKEQAAGNQLNDNQTIFPNKIFDSLIKDQITTTHLTT